LIIYYEGSLSILLTVTAVFLALGIIGNSALLVSQPALSVASWLGGSTGYTHASYWLIIQEVTVTIVVFAVLALIAL
ncbi:uncharacterized protein METZ01_LOCUS513009, partial [marine metagenome]